MNKMKEIRVEKVTLNIGAGGPGDQLEKAMRLLKKITDAKPVETRTKKRIPSWGLRPGLPIGCKVTLRGKKAEEILKKLLESQGNKLKKVNFSTEGGFSFGIKEYLDIPGVEYDISIGIIGLEAAVTLSRPGSRVRVRKIKRSMIPVGHRVSKKEAMGYMKNKFGAEVV